MTNIIHLADRRTEPSPPGPDADVRVFIVDRTLVRSQPPSLHAALLAAAKLWCRHVRWPTVRAIAAECGLSPSTVLNGCHTAERLRTVLVRSERLALARDAKRVGIEEAARRRADALRTHDPVLVWLPLLAALAESVDDGTELTALAEAAFG